MFSRLGMFLFVGLFILGGCASSHTMMRGTVAMKVDKNTAHVCLGNNQVKKGDKVAFYRNQCDPTATVADKGQWNACQLERLGVGEVTKILNSHYSTVETDGSFRFGEGTLVEKVENL